MIGTWTDKHNAFCLQERLPASTRALWQWLLEQRQEGSSEIEFDLKDFNKWVEKKRGYPLDVKTLKYARDRLIECGVVSWFKQFTWSIWRWVIKPINLLVYPVVKPQRKDSYKKEETPDPDASNPQSVADDALAAAASNSEAEILETCSEAQIPFRRSEAGNLLSHSVAEVRSAIAHFWCRGGHEKIKNPQGWLIECLRRCWWEDASDYYSPCSPIARRQSEEWEKGGRSLGVKT